LVFGVRLSAREQPPSATDSYLQTVWTTEDGLPQNSVTAIVQTRDGYLWLSTFGGLARFDGVRFTIFNSANTPGLKSNRITALVEDRRGVVWLGTETGELMSLEDGVGTTYPMTGALQGGIV
jgi:ligand-binding sensor domain-containing protein